MALNFNTSLIINTEASAGPSGESHSVREEGLGLSPREKTAGGKSWVGGQRHPQRVRPLPLGGKSYPSWTSMLAQLLMSRLDPPVLLL